MTHRNCPAGCHWTMSHHIIAMQWHHIQSKSIVCMQKSSQLHFHCHHLLCNCGKAATAKNAPAMNAMSSLHRMLQTRKATKSANHMTIMGYQTWFAAKNEEQTALGNFLLTCSPRLTILLTNVLLAPAVLHHTNHSLSSAPEKALTPLSSCPLVECFYSKKITILVS